jgi:hypothetical protein
VAVDILIVPPLREALDAWQNKGLQNKFREWCAAKQGYTLNATSARSKRALRHEWPCQATPRISMPHPKPQKRKARGWPTVQWTRFVGCAVAHLKAGATIIRKSRQNIYLQTRWQSLGESNPSSLVENQMS